MSPRQQSTAGTLLLGVGFGGFVDGIVLHQILQWHHMLTDTGDAARFPEISVDRLEENTLADGLFHAGAWIAVLAGGWLVWQAARAGTVPRGRRLAGLLLVGWGGFNLAEGIIDHHLLGIHHVRDDVVDPRWWDLGFLAISTVLLAAGLLLARARPRTVASEDQTVTDDRRLVAASRPGVPATASGRRSRPRARS